MQHPLCLGLKTNTNFISIAYAVNNSFALTSFIFMSCPHLTSFMDIYLICSTMFPLCCHFHLQTKVKLRIWDQPMLPLCLLIAAGGQDRRINSPGAFCFALSNVLSTSLYFTGLPSGPCWRDGGCQGSPTSLPQLTVTSGY